MAGFRHYRLLIIGFFLVLGGVLVPFFTMLGILPASFILLFGSYIGSVVGIALGLIWVAGYLQDIRSRNR
jgi:hypothetical protein